MKPDGSVPESYDSSGILSVPSAGGESPNEQKFSALFGQYFRVDVSLQQAFSTEKCNGS